MADEYIHDLDAIGAVDDGSLLAIEDTASPTDLKKVTAANFQAYLTISATSQMTGTLPFSNGGTGQTGFLANRVVISHSTNPYLDVSGITANELNRLDGISYDINAHNHNGAGGATIAFTSLSGTLAIGQGGTNNTSFTTGRVIISHATNPSLEVSPITSAELNYLNNINFNIKLHNHNGAGGATIAFTSLSGTLAIGQGGTNNTSFTTGRVIISHATNPSLEVSPITSAELGYLNNVSSNIQTQLNGKASTSHSHSHSSITGISANQHHTAHSGATGSFTVGLYTYEFSNGLITGYHQ